MSATNTEVTELSDNHHIPNAQLRICPDAGHGFLNQYPELFAAHVNAFLNGG
jgi:pimeloyl-ACP methyl ester carboxylesterase